VKWSEEEQQAALEGALALSKLSFALVAWGLVTGVAMSKSGLTTVEAVGMSLLAFAGSAQLAVLPLIAGGVPVWVIFLTAAIVNLRFVIFSAGIQPHFKEKVFWKRAMLGYLNGDLPFVLFMSKYPQVSGDPLRLPYFLGLAVANWSVWQASSITGILLANFIPDAWGLGFAGTLALIAVVMPMLDKGPMRLAALAAAIVAVLTVWLPFRLNLVLAVIAALVVGMTSDRIEAQRQRESSL
jgi:predicted branched-subunit amino acid permease